MSQQFHNGGGHDGSRTFSFPDSRDYAVVNPPFQGKWVKTEAQRKKRHENNIRKRLARLTKPGRSMS